MECPSCHGEVADTLARCHFCGASLAAEAARHVHGGAEPADAAPLDQFVDVHPGVAHGARRNPAPANGGVAALPAMSRTAIARPGRGAYPQQLPGTGMALASLISSIIGALLLLSCFGAVLSPIPLVLGVILGIGAIRQLPPSAHRSSRAQAQFGLWIGIIGSVIVAFFFAMVVLGFMLEMMEAAPAA